MFVFVEGGKLENLEKTLGARTRTNNKFNQKTIKTEFKISDNSNKLVNFQNMGRNILFCSRKYPYPIHGRFLSLSRSTPLEIPVLVHFFLSNLSAFNSPPPPLEFPNYNPASLPGGGGGKKLLYKLLRVL